MAACERAERLGQCILALMDWRPRVPERAELPAVVALVDQAIRETYPELARLHPPTVGPESRWAPALVVACSGRVVGAGLAAGDRITALWVAAAYRGRGAGAGILRALEAQIARAGHPRAVLRCAATNRGARRFYRRAGWRESEPYAHEVHGRPMVDLHKELVASRSPET